MTERRESGGGSCSQEDASRFVLFDLDNTLIDRQLAFRIWALSFAGDHGLGAEAVEVLIEADADGFATREAVFEIARERLHVEEPLEVLIAHYRSEYVKLFQPDPAVLSALQRLRTNGFRIGIVTNGPSTQIEKVKRAGLSALIDGVCISEDFGVEKPDVRIFAEAVRRSGGDPAPGAGGWMVGDTARSDIAGAQAFGLRSIWISRGRTWTEQDFAPDGIADDVPDAVDLIVEMSNEL